MNAPTYVSMNESMHTESPTYVCMISITHVLLNASPMIVCMYLPNASSHSVRLPTYYVWWVAWWKGCITDDAPPTYLSEYQSAKQNFIQEGEDDEW